MKKFICILIFLVFPSSHALATPETRTIFLDQKTSVTVNIHDEGSVMSFFTRPQKVIIGKQNQFVIEYEGNDIIVVALERKASASLFVYLLGRRYTFKLKAGEVKGNRIFLIKDNSEPLLEYDIK